MNFDTNRDPDPVYERIGRQAAALLQLRRFVLFALAASLAACVMLSAVILTQKDKSRTIVIAPAESTVTYSAEDDDVSANLLERFAMSALGLISNMTPATASWQTETFLKYAAPEAYGEMAAALRGGADMLAVASVQEGIQLREKTIGAPILVLGAVTGADAAAGVEYGLIQTVCSPEMVRLCEQSAAALGKTAEVHLKIDTGMGRIGVRTPEEKAQVMQELASSPHVRLTGVFTHFADADGDDDGEEYTRRQFRIFREMTADLPREVIRHCCNSAAIHRFPEMMMDMVRVGISLYGYPPVPVHPPLGLEPAMTWTAKISYIKELPAGAFVSYGRTYRCGQTVRVATVTCGYADGYHRAAGGEGFVLIHGQRRKRSDPDGTRRRRNGDCRRPGGMGRNHIL